jgi:hypothetical protein
MQRFCLNKQRWRRLAKSSRWAFSSAAEHPLFMLQSEKLTYEKISDE